MAPAVSRCGARSAESSVPKFTPSRCMPWLLTWRTYATYPTFSRREGDGRSAVSPSHEPLTLDAERREAALHSILATCRAKGWHLLAAHVRTTHIHIVLDAQDPASFLFANLKARITRALRAANLVHGAQPVWADYRNARWLTSEEAVVRAIRYVLDCQGTPMERYSPCGSAGDPAPGLGGLPV